MLEAMRGAYLVRIGLILFGVAASADTQFQIPRISRNQVPHGYAQYSITLPVDNEVEVSIRLDTIRIRTIAGRDAYDDGSECNAPLPDRDVGPIGFEVREKRNDIRLVAEPSRRNNFTAIVMIRDSSGGQGRYHFRFTWEMSGTDYRRDAPRGGFDDRRPPFDTGRPGGPGFAWNNVINFQSR